MQHLFGDAFSPLIVGAVSNQAPLSSQSQHYHPLYMQVSDMVRNYLGNYVKEDGCNVGKGVGLEFALFLTVFACALGAAAFLALTLTVEEDRRVSQPHLSPCT